MSDLLPHDRWHVQGWQPVGLSRSHGRATPRPDFCWQRFARDRTDKLTRRSSVYSVRRSCPGLLCCLAHIRLVACSTVAMTSVSAKLVRKFARQHMQFQRRFAAKASSRRLSRLLWNSPKWSSAASGFKHARHGNAINERGVEQVHCRSVLEAQSRVLFGRPEHASMATVLCCGSEPFGLQFRSPWKRNISKGSVCN